ncbi:MAG TPA: SPW repeat protein [Salinarimonas sp.]|nr:SPW repeat protein [Salinarimonas sp.]
MRVIPTRVHGMIDYATGFLLIVAPYLFGFANGGIAQYLPMLLGAAIIGMSLFTDYELSLSRMIPLPMHLGVDVAGGALLAVSPWLFGFADRVYWPHLIIGLAEIGVGLMTRSTPDTGHVTTGRI